MNTITLIASILLFAGALVMYVGTMTGKFDEVIVRNAGKLQFELPFILSMAAVGPIAIILGVMSAFGAF